MDYSWKKIVLPILEPYTEATDGSFIEEKDSALVWHHQDADPHFGSSQAKELLDHLESVLVNEPVVVKRGQHIVEVKPLVCFVLNFFMHAVISSLDCCENVDGNLRRKLHFSFE